MNNFIEYTVRVYPDRTEWLNKSGKLHRKDGPAYIVADGKYWYIEGKLHRTNGPAVDRTDGTKEWFVDGKLHREDGPAAEWADGSKEWWVDGKQLSERKFAEFQSKNSNPSCAGRIVEIDGRKYQLKAV